MVWPALRFGTVGLVCLFLLTTARADDPRPPDPLRLVPDAADFAIKVEQPRQVIDLALRVLTMKELRGFTQYREYYDSTDFHRFLQLVAYFEKQLGHPWPELVDRLAGGGVVVATKFGEQPPPVLLIIQGKDPELTRKFIKVTLEVAEQELARLESKVKVEKHNHRGIDMIAVPDQFIAAALDSAIVITNKPKAMEAAIGLHLDKKPKSLAEVDSVKQARQLVPVKSLAWAWVNVDKIKESPQAQELYKLPGPFGPLHAFIGGWIDVAKRSPFVTAALYQDEKGPVVTVRAPTGSKGMNEAISRIHRPDGVGALPPLQPKGVLFSHSFYLNVNEFWEQRAKLLSEEQVQALDQANKQSGGILIGSRLSQILTSLGARHRIVVAAQHNTGYTTQPAVRIPSFGFVLELKNADEFMKSTEPAMRSVGLLAGFGAKMNLIEEKHGDAKIVGYRFAEDAKNKALNDGVLFNFSPCFVRVGNYFIITSTLELAHNLADAVETEGKAAAPLSTAAMQSKFTWAGVAATLDTIRDQLTTQIILNDGSSPEEAKKQVDLLINLLGKLGWIESSLHYDPDQFRWDFRVISGMSK